MKILFIASESSFNSQIISVLNNRGVDLRVINDRNVLIFNGLLKKNGKAWSLMRKNTALKTLNNALFNREIIKECREWRPDYLFAAKGITVSTDTLREARSMGVKTINWFPENIYHPNYLSWFLATYQEYDFFFTFISSIVNDYGGKGRTRFTYLPLAVDPAYYSVEEITAEDIKRFECDICFVGAPYPEREALLSLIVGWGYDLKIFGWDGWSRSKLSSHYHGALPVGEMAKAFYLSRISLQSNLHPVNSGVNQRTFEIPASKGFELSDRQRDLAQLFEIGKEVEVYDDVASLKDKISFYLNNRGIRDEIALAGYKRVVSEHTMERRVDDLLAIINTK